MSRVMRFAELMLEFDGETTIRKSFMKSNDFTRYPFQLVKIDALEPTNNRYLIDVVGCMTNVGRTTQTRTGSKTLDFYLANCRGQQIKVTLWGGPGDMLIQNRTCHVGLTSSTLIINDEKIHVLKRMKTDDRGCVVMFDETVASLLGCSASCILDSKEQVYFLASYNLANTFTYLDMQDEEDHSGLPITLANIVGITHTLELKYHTYFEHGNYESFTCWNIVTIKDGEGEEEGTSSGTVATNKASKVSMPKRVSKTPMIDTPSKPRVEDSDAEESFIAESVPKGGVICSSDTMKRRRVSSPNVATWNQPRLEQPSAGPQPSLM
nr:hypothetical protein [Tanacetum cinerariifolium]